VIFIDPHLPRVPRLTVVTRPTQFNYRTGGVSRSPSPASSARGERFGGGSGSVGGAAQES